MPDRIRMQDALDPESWAALDRWRDAEPYRSVLVHFGMSLTTLDIVGSLEARSVRRDSIQCPTWQRMVEDALAAWERMELERASSVERAWSDGERDSRELEAEP